MGKTSLIALLWLGMLGATYRAPSDASGPSFDCRRVHSSVNKLICATPDVAVLDRKLATDFNNAKYQGGSDGKALQAAEDAWLRDVRNKCADATCLRNAYQARDAQILDDSLRAASPAAYADTLPFPADRTAWSEVRSFIGQSCSTVSRDLHIARSGFSTPNGFLTIVGPGGFFVEALEKNGARFAFLVQVADASGLCTIRDVVVLPAPDKANAYLQCNIEDVGMGPGMRRAGKSDVVAFWTIDAQKSALQRQPVNVLGQGTIRCQQPESGD
jgi:uncharacterized protein